MAQRRTVNVEKITKDLMHELGFSNVRQFSEHLGCNYMQLYYCYSGRNNELSDELVKCILYHHPNVRREFLLHGEEPIFKGEELLNKQSFEIPTELTPNDIYVLLERITTLLEKVEQREERLEEKLNKVERLEKELQNKLNGGCSSKFQVS